MRLIDADALKKRSLRMVTNTNGMTLPIYMRAVGTREIDRAPTIEAVPVVHGKWVDNGIPDSMLSKCSICGYPCGAYSLNFCPNCGAKMDA